MAQMRTIRQHRLLRRVATSELACGQTGGLLVWTRRFAGMHRRARFSIIGEVSVQDQIYEWVKTFEPWKQELFLRAAASPELTEQDVREVTSMLLGEKVDGTGPREVSRDDLPDAFGADEPMIVHRLADLQNVNIIADGETLSFGDSGINVVYGANGAGKTGYSRVLKRAGRTLHRETVLSNVKEENAGPPRATVVIEIGDQKQDVAFELDNEPPAVLGRICVADSKAGERYLISDTEVDYAPETLKSVRRLADVLKAVEEEVGRRLDLAQPGEIDLRPFGEGTEAAGFVNDLDATTTEEQVTSLSTLSDEEQEQRKLLKQQLGEIEARQAPKLREAAESSARTAATLLARLGEVSTALSDAEIETARGEQKALQETREAARIAAQRFDAEPVSGVGSEPWRVLWQAARDFAEHQAQKLPPEHDPAHCLLCMQELTQEARECLVGFDEFVRDDISARLRAAEGAVSARRDRLPDIATLRATHAQALEQLGQEPGQPGDEVSQWLDRVEQVIDRIKQGELENLAGVDPLPASVETWIADRREEAASHAALEKSDDQGKVRRAVAELDARRELGERREEIIERLRRMREVERLEKAKAKTGTAAVSKKMTALSRELVEADLQGALTRQLKALDFRGLEVAPKTRTKSGTPMMGLKFKTVDGAPLTAVLSQGEQRRLSLAMFLAEMEVLPGGSPVVFDDPVSSIDQEGRRHIARTLAELAANRQVIVFTHEISFVHELERQAASRAALTIQHVLRIGDTAGNVRPSLPWEGLSSRKRIAPLQEKLGSVREAYESGDPDIYTGPVIEFCALLRGAFERTVEDRVFAGVITRREDSIHTKLLDRVHCTEEICQLVDRGMDENSPWVHDRAAADGSVIPTVDELKSGLDLYEELHRKLGNADAEREKERKKSKQARTAKLQAVEADARDGVVQPEKLRVVSVDDGEGSKEPA
jgi:predicted ATPase